MRVVKSKSFFVALLLGIIFASCNKKELDLSITDKACENLELTNINYQWIDDPSIDSNSLTRGVVEFSFDFTGEARCVDIVEFATAAYDCNNSKIDLTDYSASVHKTSGDLIVTGNSAKVTFSMNFASIPEGNALNHLIIKLFTKNDLGDKSAPVEIRVNATDNVVKPNTYNVNDDVKTVSFNANYFTITLWDYAAEDGDIVSVYLNGEWIIENFSMLNAKTDFRILRSKLFTGTNHLVVFAQNEGDVGANTAAIAINGSEVSPFKPGLKTGEAVQIKVN
jgi:hypothetical protein